MGWSLGERIGNDNSAKALWVMLLYFKHRIFRHPVFLTAIPERHSRIGNKALCQPKAAAGAAARRSNEKAPASRHDLQANS